MVKLYSRRWDGGQAFLNLIPRGELIGVVVLILIGVALIVLAPAKQFVEPAAAEIPTPS
jgi:hypothetical protein